MQDFRGCTNVTQAVEDRRTSVNVEDFSNRRFIESVQVRLIRRTVSRTDRDLAVAISVHEYEVRSAVVSDRSIARQIELSGGQKAHALREGRGKVRRVAENDIRRGDGSVPCLRRTGDNGDASVVRARP